MTSFPAIIAALADAGVALAELEALLEEQNKSKQSE